MYRHIIGGLRNTGNLHVPTGQCGRRTEAPLPDKKTMHSDCPSNRLGLPRLPFRARGSHVDRHQNRSVPRRRHGRRILRVQSLAAVCNRADEPPFRNFGKKVGLLHSELVYLPLAYLLRVQFFVIPTQFFKASANRAIDEDMRVQCSQVRCIIPDEGTGTLFRRLCIGLAHLCNDVDLGA